MTASPTRLQPRRRPKQARSAETRERILDAAAHVFSEHGYAAGTTNRIAEAAGMSIGSLYQYFPNKDSILVELARRHADAGTAALRTALAAGLPDDLDDRLRVLIRVAVDQHRDDHRLHQVLFEEAPRPASFLADLHEQEDQLIEVVAALLAADPSVRVTDHRVAARMAVTTVESVVHRLVATRSPALSPDDVIDELTAMLSRYLRGAP